MLEALLPIFFFGLFQVSSQETTALATLQSLVIAPPAQEQLLVQPVSASGIVVINAKTGQLVYGKESNTKLPMASITKLMTALIIVENHDINEIVTIPTIATEIAGQKAYLKAKDQFTVGDLLSALLIYSANDAALALAIYHSGTEEDFVRLMNKRAEELGLKNTSYQNAAGLDSQKQFSTPQDIAWLTMHALDHPIIAEKMSKPAQTIVSSRGNITHLYHTHAFLHQNTLLNEPIVKSGKTGTTNAAKQCLVSLVEAEHSDYIVVLLHSSNRYADLTKVMTSLETKQMIGYHASSR